MNLKGIFSDDNNGTTHELTLTERLAIEKSTIHWLPYKRILVHELADGSLEEECDEGRPRAIEEFPDGWWTRKCLEQLNQAIKLHSSLL
jgi:hypothetical protein